MLMERFSYDLEENHICFCLEKWFRYVFVICFISQWMKRSKHVFPPKKTLIWKRHCSIGQSCCSMTSKRSIGWFLESSWAFFTKSQARLYPSDKQMKSLYSRSFVSVFFLRFHFKVIRKSLYLLKRIWNVGLTIYRMAGCTWWITKS